MVKNFNIAVFLALIFWLSSGMSQAEDSFPMQVASQVKPDLKIKEVYLFTETRPVKDAKWIYKKWSYVLRAPDNSCYGFHIKLDTPHRSVRLKQTFTMPSSPETWKIDGEYEVKNSGKTAIREWEETLRQGSFTNSWCVKEGDPLGKYLIELSINDKIHRNFIFTVVDELPEDPLPEKRKIRSVESFRKNLGSYGKHVLRLSTIYEEFMDILSITGEIDSISTAYISGEVSPEYAQEQKAMLGAKAGLKLKTLEERLGRLERKETGEKRFNDITNSFHDYLKSLPATMNEFLDISMRMADAALADDIELFSDLDVKSRDATIVLLEGENNIIKLRKMNLGKNSPGYHLMGCMQQSNEVLINMIKARISERENMLSADELGGMSDEQVEYIEDARTALKKGFQIIENHHSSFERWFQMFKREMARIVKDAGMFDRLKKSVDRSFEVEDEIFAVLKVALDEYPDGDFDQGVLLIQHLANERSVLQNERTQMLADMK